jgi:hypothetical protein
LNMYLVSFVDTGKIRYIWSETSVEFEEFSREEDKILKDIPEFNNLIKTFQWM